MDPSEYFCKFREEWAEVAIDVDQPDHWSKFGEVIQHCERCGNVPQIATIRRRNDGNSGDRLARCHCAVRDVVTGGELLVGSRPAGEGIGELAHPTRRRGSRQAANGMTDTDDAMRRGSTKPGRQPGHPAIEHLGPRSFLQFFAEEHSPVGEPTALAESVAPVPTGNTIAGR